MAQYGDSYNPFNASSSRPSSSSDPPRRAAPAAGDGDSSGQLRADGGSGDRPVQSTSEPNQEMDSHGVQSASWESRRRNQWRQFQRLEPSYGASADRSPPVDPGPPQRPTRATAALPSLGGSPRPAPPSQSLMAAPGPQGRQPRMPSHPSPDLTFLQFSARSPGARNLRPAPAPQPMPASGPTAPGPTALPSPVPLVRHPEPLGRRPVPAADAAVRPLPPGHSKVTALRPRRRPAAVEPSTLGAGSGATSRSAPSPAARRPLVQVPLPVLYLIRLLILGVGVAAIAGTLLSMLSPANLASTSAGNSLGAATADTGSGGRPIARGGVSTDVQDIALTSEMTRLKAQLEQLGTLTPGLNQSIFVVDLDSGQFVDLNSEGPVAAASTIKVPILVAFLQAVDQGTIALNQGLTLQEYQIAGGSGKMQTDAVGTQYPALQVATQMIIHSDNTATNMMIDLLGGAETLNQQFAAWGLSATVIRNPLPDLEGTNTTSVKDLALLMTLVDQGGLISPRSRDRMFAIMQRTVNRSLIPAGVAPDAVIANKTGDIESVLGDVALIDAANGKRYVLSALVQRPNNDGRAGELIRRIAETTYDELNQPLSPVGGGNPSPSGASPEVNEAPAYGDPSDPTFRGDGGTPEIPSSPSAPAPTGSEDSFGEPDPPTGDQMPQG